MFFINFFTFVRCECLSCRDAFGTDYGGYCRWAMLNYYIIYGKTVFDFGTSRLWAAAANAVIINILLNFNILTSIST